jgi:hypothetical protein
MPGAGLREDWLLMSGEVEAPWGSVALDRG